jgi:cytochrome P450
MRKGESVLLAMCLANRDPAAFPDPHRIDIDRNRGTSLTFATGPHTCLGVHLARREIRIVLEVLLPRLCNLRLPEGSEFTYHTGLGVGIDRLSLEWDPN